MTVASDNTRITTLGSDEDGFSKLTDGELDLVEKALGRIAQKDRDSDAGKSLVVKLKAMRDPTHPDVNEIAPYKTEPTD